MSLPDADLALLVQTRQRVDKLLEELRQNRRQISPSPKLDAASAADGIDSIDELLAALKKISAAAKVAMQQKGLS